MKVGKCQSHKNSPRTQETPHVHVYIEKSKKKSGGAGFVVFTFLRYIF